MAHFKANLLSYLITLLIFVLPISKTYAEDHKHQEFDIASHKVILKFDGKTLMPAKLILEKLGTSVFFINTSENQNVHLDIDFRDKRLHCHSENLKLIDNHIRTTLPIKPRNFEILCFPSSGVYQYEVKADLVKGSVYKGEIDVRE